MALDPNNYNYDGPTEFSWGAGIFPPGIAGTPGPDFGEASIGDITDTFAAAVADRRTDPTDPDSTRDFAALGNPDRYGPQPALIQEDGPSNVSEVDWNSTRKPLERKR